MTNATALIKRLGELKSERQPHESTWDECYRFGCPERVQSFSGGIGGTEDRKKARADLVDSTATGSVQLLVSSIMSGATPPNSLWFAITPDGKDPDETTQDEGERWLDEVANFIWRNIHASNFDAEAFEATTDGVVAGWLALYIDTDRDNGGYVFDAWPLSSCWIASSRADGRIDTIYREHQLTAAQCIDKYGDAVSERVQKLYKKSPDAKVTILHVIEPRPAPHGVIDKKLPFASYHIETEGKHLLKESGYHEFPCAVARWRRIPNSVYAEGQMSVALPDAKAANRLATQTLQHGDMAIGGMWIAEDDGVLNPATIRIGARRVIVANSVDSIKPLTSGMNFEVAEWLLKSVQAAIRRNLMSDQLQMQDGPQMTATEVNVRVDLIRQQLGPVYGRWQSEYLVPLLERCFGLALRAGQLGEPPESLMGRDLQIKFQSPLARSQRLEEVVSIERFSAGVAQMAQANPDILDNIDFDAATQLYGKGLGVPAAVMRTSDGLQAYREQKAQAAQQAQQQQQQMALQQKAGEAAIDTTAKTAMGAA
jgi:hypothetical protein